MIKIYGRSDDLIKVEGGIVEEFDCFDKSVIIVCNTGTVIRGDYAYPGVWLFDIVAAKDVVEKKPQQNTHPESITIKGDISKITVFTGQIDSANIVDGSCLAGGMGR